MTEPPFGTVPTRSHVRAFRSLLWRLRPQSLEVAVCDIIGEVHQLTESGVGLAQAFEQVYRRARLETIERLSRVVIHDGDLARISTAADPAANNKTRRLLDDHIAPNPSLDGPDFHCDAGLGGLARLLRAAGYDAAFWPGIDDDELLDKVLAGSALLLTNDRLLIRRGVIERGVVPALLVPITIKKREQLAHVMEQLDLPLGSPRCMACGGRLVGVDKESVRDRIPPRTYPWRDDYHVCQRCDKLFWQGTHWQSIRTYLNSIRVGQFQIPKL